MEIPVINFTIQQFYSVNKKTNTFSAINSYIFIVKCAT